MSLDNPRLDAVKISERHESGRVALICFTCLLALWYALNWFRPIRDEASQPFTSKVMSDSTKHTTKERR